MIAVTEPKKQCLSGQQGDPKQGEAGGWDEHNRAEGGQISKQVLCLHQRPQKKVH